MRPSPRSGRRHRSVAVALLALGVLVALAVPAAAHVTVKPDKAAKGSYSTFSFSVPNERDDASTVTLEVTFPREHPIRSVRVQPVPGWTWTAEKTTVADPEDSGKQIEVVSKITWTGGEIAPGEFQLFTVSAGPLPTDTKQLELQAVQTYSSGEVVRWVEPTPKRGPEPRHPAPFLKLTGKARSH